MPRERLELIRLWRLVDELQIGEEQAVRLFPFWSNHRRQTREIQQDRKKAVEELVNLLGREEVRDEALKEKMKQIRAIEKKKEELARIFHEKMADLLTVRQQALLLLFQEKFRKDLQDFLKEVRPLRHRREEARERGFWEGRKFWK